MSVCVAAAVAQIASLCLKRPARHQEEEEAARREDCTTKVASYPRSSLGRWTSRTGQDYLENIEAQDENMQELSIAAH